MVQRNIDQVVNAAMPSWLTILRQFARQAHPGRGHGRKTLHACVFVNP
jgi:hypothetical protein